MRATSLPATTASGILHYVWFKDRAAGKPGVYTVLVLSSGDPVIIGRELPESFIPPLLKDFESEAKKLQDKGEWFYGERNFVLTVRNLVTALRQNRAQVDSAHARKAVSVRRSRR